MMHIVATALSEKLSMISFILSRLCPKVLHLYHFRYRDMWDGESQLLNNIVCIHTGRTLPPPHSLIAAST